MTRTVFAIAAAALLFAVAAATSQAAPIAPPAGAGAADTDMVTQVYWHHYHWHHHHWHHRHCWHGSYGHLHCHW